MAARVCRHNFLKSFKILLKNTHSHFPIIRDIIGKNTKGDKAMGLFGSSRDKETIERLTQQLNQQRAEYERKISEKDAEMSELKVRYSKREDSILAVKEIELKKLKDKIKALEDEVLRGRRDIDSLKKCASLESQVKTRKENENLKLKISKIEEELQNKISEIDKLKKDKFLKDNIDAKKDFDVPDLQRLSEDIKKLQEEIDVKNGEIEELKRNYSTILRDRDAEILHLKNKMEDLKTENREYSREVELKSGKFVLPAGKYKGGIDIPVGVYNMRVISGQGSFKTNRPEEVYENISSDKNHGFGFLNEYRNLEISEKTILRIESSATVEFSISRKYDFSGEYEEEKRRAEERISEVKREYESKKYDIEHEIKILEKELKKLNDECVRKYYQFSSYDSLTSQDCKNELAILKQKEMELRREESDITKQKGVTMSARDKRIARQMLRTFNAECDNIMMNISLKSIDKARSQIQKSFDTVNTIYTNGNWLDHSLLELKLQQATLIYTYELKYQQEKDIQRAIKEQMLEEAKAQREIEEQKKKIEKDLQQHLGEVNRIMKYMQKTQIDAEKQLYMDKIKELEEKIKVLQSDKETVLEREANAKAGFVYIISNIGSFGENIYKIGMTRRLEPMDRIHELSSASVPFEFDVHAMIFSSDAPELETTLHRHFVNNAVNKVNPRKEFYNVDIDDIERVVKENYNDTVQFTKIPIAAEYRQSLNLMESAEQKPPVLQEILDIGMEIEENE